MSVRKFDILDKTGKQTGKCATERRAHEQGLWHQVVQLCITDGNGNIFQQQSAHNAHAQAKVWDLFTLTSHVLTAESPEDALVRELRTMRVEASLSTLQKGGLKHVGISKGDYWVEDLQFPDGGYLHRTFCSNFVVKLPSFNLGRLSLRFPGVVAVRKYPIKGLMADLRLPANDYRNQQHRYYTTDNDVVYETVLEGIEDLNI